MLIIWLGIAILLVWDLILFISEIRNEFKEFIKEILNELKEGEED